LCQFVGSSLGIHEMPRVDFLRRSFVRGQGSDIALPVGVDCVGVFHDIAPLRSPALRDPVADIMIVSYA
jgi:hypothetical protein